MASKRSLPYGIEDAESVRPKKTPPVFITCIAIACTVLAGLGDWKFINDRFGGLPKAVALGTIACAVLNFLVDADFKNLKKAFSYFPVFMLLIASYVIISMYIWMTDFAKLSSISRVAQKILFQTITIVYAVCMCYLFETRAINYLFACMCATNGAIMLLEMPKYGIVQSVVSVLTCIVTFGDAEGFVRSLEIHDITFLFGQFFIYYMMFAPKETQSEKRLRYICIALCIFFMLVGLKRSSVPAVILMCVYVTFVRMLKKPEKFILFTGICFFVFFCVYLYLVRSGILISFLESLGIPMLGRDVLWSLPNDYYELSPFWKGLGFEGVHELIDIWVREGLLKRGVLLHNDILKVFIELGSLGFTFWVGLQYILYPLYWSKRHDTESALLYMAILGYMSVTYLTDNTAFYFWSCVGLRLIPMSYSYRIYRAEKKRKWKPLNPEDAVNEIWMIEMEGDKKRYV